MKSDNWGDAVKSGAFMLSGLERIWLPSSLYHLGACVFYGCSRL